MKIWKKYVTSLDTLNRMGAGTIHDALGIRFIEGDAESLSAEMPVDARTQQPFGLLHGGASVVLAESLGSMAAYLAIEGEDRVPVGVEVNANHLRAVHEGKVTGRATPIHLGGSLQVWEVRITDDGGALVCVARLTVMIRERKAPPT